MRGALLIGLGAVVLGVAALAPAQQAARASGSGGAISLGAVGGAGSSRTVEVLTGTATDPWSGYQVHVAALVGGALTLDSIAAANGTLLGGGPTCLDSTPGPWQHVLGCATLGSGRPAITAAGQLAVFTFNTTGNGCVVVRLVTSPVLRNSTYTVDWATSTAQTNAVDTSPVSILVGSGTNADCPDPLADDDGDGCANGKEQQLAPPTDPNDPWDFYSVPVPPLFLAANPVTDVRDGIVAASDAQSVFAYFKVGAKTGTTEYEQDLDQNGARDGLQYDRHVVSAGHSGAPDGIIAASDAQLAFAQFKSGYHC